jgi:hypothetical protein
MRIDRSIVYRGTSDAGIQRTSLDSLLGVGCPLRGRAVSSPGVFTGPTASAHNAAGHSFPVAGTVSVPATTPDAEGYGGP